MSAALRDAAAQVAQDASRTHLALLDATGRIVAVNDAWQQFVVDNDGDPDLVGPGVDYLSTCAGAVGPDGDDGQRVVHAIRAALVGESERVAAVYPCHGPLQRRWFEVRVRPVGGRGALVEHHPTTERQLLRQLRETLATLGAAAPDVEALEDLGQALAADQEVLRDALPRLGGLRDTLARPTSRGLSTAGALVDGAMVARPDLCPPVVVRDEDVVVPVDVRIVSSVIGELLRNVRQHAGGTAVVDVVPRTDGGVRVTVEDDGPGIPADQRGAAVLPLLGDAVGRGLGLGLPIARTLVHHHGGWLLLEDAVGGGCRVHVEL